MLTCAHAGALEAFARLPGHIKIDQWDRGAGPTFAHMEASGAFLGTLRGRSLHSPKPPAISHQPPTRTARWPTNARHDD